MELTIRLTSEMKDRLSHAVSATGMSPQAIAEVALSLYLVPPKPSRGILNILGMDKAVVATVLRLVAVNLLAYLDKAERPQGQGE